MTSQHLQNITDGFAPGGFFGMIYPTENGHEIWSSECHESLQIKYWKHGITYDKYCTIMKHIPV